MTTEVIRYKIRTEQATAFEEAYRKAEPILQNSPDCLAYRLLQGDEEPANWILLIHWQSSEHNEHGYLREKAFRTFFALLKPFLLQVEEIRRYNQTQLSWSRQFRF